jgi:hypothetical protein
MLSKSREASIPSIVLPAQQVSSNATPLQTAIMPDIASTATYSCGRPESLSEISFRNCAVPDKTTSDDANWKKRMMRLMDFKTTSLSSSHIAAGLEKTGNGSD